MKSLLPLSALSSCVVCVLWTKIQERCYCLCSVILTLRDMYQSRTLQHIHDMRREKQKKWQDCQTLQNRTYGVSCSQCWQVWSDEVGDISSDKTHNSEHFGHFRFPIPAANWQFLIKVWTYVIGLPCLLRTMLEYQKVHQVWTLQYGVLEKHWGSETRSKGLDGYGLGVH